MQDIEGRLGNASRRFDDWMDEDQFASRLTVIRSDGVPQTFESRAESHVEARRRVCLLAISANAMDYGEGAEDGFGGPVNGSGGIAGDAYGQQTAGHGATVPGSSRFAGHVSGSVHGSLNAPMHGAMPGSALGAMPGVGHGPMPPGFAGAMPGFMAGLPFSMNGMYPWSMGGGGPFIAHPGIASGSEAMGNPGMTGMMPMNIPPYMAMQGASDMPGMQRILAGAQTMSVPENKFPDRSAESTGEYFGTNEREQFLPDHMKQTGARRSAAVFNSGIHLNSLKALSKRHMSPQARHVADKTRKISAFRKDWNATQFNHPTSPIRRRSSEKERVDTYSNREAKGSWYDVVDNITSRAVAGGQQKSSELQTDSRAISGGRSRVVQDNESSHSSDDTENAARRSDRRQYSNGRVPTQDKAGSNPSVFETKDDDDDNCLTKFNELCQKGVAGLRVPRYYYEHKSDCPGMTPVWNCTAVTSAQSSENAESIPLRVVVQGKNKKDARRVAAKHLLADLIKFGLVTQDIVDMKISSIPDVPPEEPDALCPSPTVSPEVAAAVSVLNQLWQKEKLACKPKWSVVPVSSGATGRWKCDLLIKTKQLGDIESSYTSSQKKTCRQMAAYKAVQRLTEMKFAGLCSVNVNARQQSNVSAEAPDLDSDDDESSWIENEIDRPCRETEVVAEPNPPQSDRDAVSPFSGGDAGFGSLFCVPEGTEVVFAESEADCAKWVSSNVLGGDMFGLYLDSYDVRDTFKAYASSAGIDVNSKVYKSNECHVVCLASKTSALVAHVDKFVDARQSPRQSADLERKGSCMDDGASCSLKDKSLGSSCQSVSNLPTKNKSWIPQSIRLVLARRDCAKYGMALDEGALVLHARHGVTCRGMNDLAVASFALKGMSGSRDLLLPKPDELVSDWLRQNLDPFSLRSVRCVSGLSETSNSTADSILPALLTATASIAIQRRIAESAESRRKKLFPNTEEYSELCARLCYPPALMPSLAKDPAPAETVMVAKHITNDNASAPISVV
jgi:hypothetical protein